jgi:type IV pilus assembly protein PilM
LLNELLKLKKDTFGLDIGLRSMKIVQIQGRGKNAYLVGATEVEVPPKCITKNGVREKDKLVQIIKQAIKQTRPKKINANLVSSALPESLVFTKAFDLPNMSPKELAKNIPFQTLEFFPLPKEETYLDWQVVGTQPDGTMEVFAVAAPKIVVDSLVETILLAGLEPVAIETKPIAITRALVSSDEKGPILLIDIGAENSSMICYDQSTIKLTSTLTLGGDKIAQDVEKGVSLLANEVSHLTKYYQNRLSQSRLFKKIILAGGGAQIEQLPEMLERITKIQTEIGKPIIKVNNYHPKFAVAIGLALKEI